MSTQELTYCGDLAHRHDPDRFLLTLMMPPEKRPALWALLAFNHEIAKTREVVTDTTIGLIRLQWWRDALAALYEGKGDALQNEILPELRQAIETHDLPREEFDHLLYAREFDLEDVLPGSLDGMEHYADFTHTPLCRLALRILSHDGDDEDTVRAVAAGYSLIGLLRAIPFHAAQSRCYLPADLMAEHVVTERALYVGQPDGNLPAVVCAVAERAAALLGEVRPQSRFLKLMALQAQLRLRHLKVLDYDVFNGKLVLGPPFFHLRFTLRALFLR